MSESKRDRKIVVGVYMNPDLLKLTKVYAALEDRTLSSLVSEALQIFFLMKMGYHPEIGRSNIIPPSSLEQITQILNFSLEERGKERLHTQLSTNRVEDSI